MQHPTAVDVGTITSAMENTSVLSQHLNYMNLITTFLLYFVLSVVTSFWRAPRYPTSIPWVGHGKSWRVALSNTFGSFTNSKSWMLDGYTKYSKSGKPFVLPSSIGQAAEVVIPRTQTQWMLDQPDNVLSTSAAHYDILHGDYSFVKPIILQDPYHEHIIHKNLARNLNTFIPDLADEVQVASDDFFGMQEEWHSINLLDSFMKLVPRLTNRMFVGKPLCRNKDFLSNMEGFTNDVIRGFFLFPLIPTMLHPVVGTIAGLAPKYHFWRTAKYSLPLIKKRLADIKRKDAEDPEYKDWKEPNDFITWAIRTAMAEGRNDELEPSRIALRILPLNFASIHTTSLTGQAALLDVLSADPSVVEALREEAARVYEEEGNKWTKQGLARMYKMDSAIRESQRHSLIALTFVHRKVVAKEGITGPDGTHYQHGVLLSCPWGGLGWDEELHKDADSYDAFRYSREREEYEAKAAVDRDRAEGLKLRQTALVTTSDKHLPFSHGRHAWQVEYPYGSYPY